MKKDKIVVKGVLLGDMQTKMASLVCLANRVPLANMHQPHPVPLAQIAKRGDIKMKKGKMIVKGVLLGDMETKMASLVQLARHVMLVNMHQSKLLCAKTARLDNIRNKTQLLLLPVKHVMLVNMLRTS